MLSLLRNLEFRILAVTQFLSIAGDQLARVALSVLVFNRTDSALQAAIAYALTFVPAAIGGPLLSGLADRRPRKAVMIASDLIRAPLIGLIAIPSIPLWLAMVLLAVAGLFEAPFDAARGALLPDVLHGDRYTAGLAFFQITIQVAQVGGFGLAGILLVAWSPSVLLIIDAASFVFSAILIGRLISYRPAAHIERRERRETERRASWWTYAFADLKLSVEIVLRSPQIRPLAFLAWSASFFAISFEALGAPLARDSGSADWTVGMLLASQPLGTVIGAVFAVRVPRARRQLAMQLLALLALAPLVIGLLHPPLTVLIVMGLFSGLGMSFNVLASTAFVAVVAPAVRGRALGLVGTGLLVGQGLGVLLAGGIAAAVDARVAVGWLGVAGTIAVLVTLWDGSRTRHTS
jgi:MFS family permease